MNDEEIGPDLSHPDAVIRLASAVHRFRCPEMARGKGPELSFARSFKTAGSHPKTKALTLKADEARHALSEVLIVSKKGSTISNASVVHAAKDYLPLIHQVLLTCKVQPEVARLDERLVFEWASGIEMDKTFFKSEALMYEMIMTIASEAMGLAGSGCDECIAGDFAAAGRSYKAAAGIMEFLGEDQLPKWISRGTSVEDKELPSEASVGTCLAFKTLFLAIGQQMAVATVLVKPGTPNYSLLAKLCLGIAEHMETFVSTMRSKASLQQSRIDPTFFTLVTFQINLQRALSIYFLARSVWDTNQDYGLAIAMMSEATVGMRTRATPTAKGLPEIDTKANLRALSKDLTDLRAHMQLVLRTWEKDNSTVYFEKVPQVVPEDKRLQKGLMMMKPEPFVLEEVEPVPLSLPASKPPVHPSPPPLQRSDSDLARELQERLNKGGL